MKKTLYFKTTTEVEEYYPNGVPSNVIAIVGDGSNVFISSDNENLKNQKFFNADLTNDEIVAEQVADAEASGYETGHAEGYSEGEAAGYDTGYSAGETAGYTAGETAGEANGYNAAEAVRNCLKFTNVNNSGASTITIHYRNYDNQVELNALNNSIQFSNDGIHWELWGFDRTITLENKEDFIYVKSDLGYLSKDASNYAQFIMTGKIAASGDITSLLNGTGGNVDLSANNRSYNFYSLFKNCTALTSAPKLPSTTLSRQCYGDMFYCCTSLLEAPVLPAPILKEGSYQTMFYGCTAMEAINCYAEVIIASNSTFNWLYNVAATGTFTKVGSMRSFTTGTSGIPSGWTVENYGDYDTGYTDGQAKGEAVGYDNGYNDGYDEGYDEGVAAGGTNWIDVLYLDEKTNAETYLGITGTWPGEDGGFQKYNYCNDVPYDVALGLVQGLQSNKTLMKLIKITKDANDNSIVTSQAFNFNYDGTNIGSISMDGNTYSSILCFWSTVTLAVGDEVILDCAAQIEYQGATLALGLFGGFDENTSDPATYKCETAGTYTFAITLDPPQVQDGSAALDITTMFNYEGSATVPAIAVPTGETSGGGGSSEPTAEELDQQAYLFFTQGPGYEYTNEVMTYVETCGYQAKSLNGIDGQLFKAYLENTNTFNSSDAPYNIYITLYDPTQTQEFQWGTWSGYLTPRYNYSTNANGYPVVTVTLSPSTNCKIGFGLLPLKDDNGLTADTNLSISTFLKCFDNGEVDGDNNTIYRHLTDIERGKTYTATFTTSTDPESGDVIPSFSFTEVQS